MLAKEWNKITIALLVGMLFTQTHLSADPKKQAVFFIGSGRCGSSCAAGMSKILGLNLGRPLLGGNENNPKGFFEHVYFLTYNNIIFKELGVTYFDTAPFILDQTTPLFQKHKKILRALFKKFFPDAIQFGIKDARITLLLPLYVQAAEESGYEVKIILVTRDIEEIAESFLKSNGTSQQVTRDFIMQFIQKHYILLDDYFKKI